MTKQNPINIFDKIRREAEEKRAKKLEQQQKNDEFFARMKNGDDSLDQINKILAGENK